MEGPAAVSLCLGLSAAVWTTLGLWAGNVPKTPRRLFHDLPGRWYRRDAAVNALVSDEGERLSLDPTLEESLGVDAATAHRVWVFAPEIERRPFVGPGPYPVLSGRAAISDVADHARRRSWRRRRVGFAVLGALIWLMPLLNEVWLPIAAQAFGNTLPGVALHEESRPTARSRIRGMIVDTSQGGYFVRLTDTAPPVARKTPVRIRVLGDDAFVDPFIVDGTLLRWLLIWLGPTLSIGVLLALLMEYEERRGVPT